MNVFVFSTHVLWSPHEETELEIMQKHLNKGDTIYRFVCKGEFPVCDANIDHRLHACLRCVDRQVYSKTLLDPNKNIINVPIISAKYTTLAKAHDFNYNDLEVFKQARIDNFDVGYAVSSSIISLLRDPSPSLIQHSKFFQDYFYSSLAVYYSALDHIEKYNPDVIYAFNGRVAHAKPVLRAAQKKGIECRVHERGCDVKHYSITVNTTPHDIKNFQVQMQNAWDAADPVLRMKTGESFFEERVQGKEQGWVSFVKSQEANLLPDNWDSSKRNIAIFNTSEDEYESIGPEWKNILYSTQAGGIEKILQSFLDKRDFHFYLRFHPNLAEISNVQVTSAYELKKYPNLTIIDANSPVSTYHLMMQSEKTVTFGSSTGIEAVYWGKPSILLGKSYYYYLDLTFIPAKHEETVSLIMSDLKPKDKTNALKYGFYFKTFGIPFQYFKPADLYSGKFKNVDINGYKSSKRRVLEQLFSVGMVKQTYQIVKKSRYVIQSLILKL